LIGNDIVDLSDPQAKGKSRDTRFINRVFSEEEKQQILNCSEPDFLLWSLWAGKETGYKAICKANADVTAVPRRYEVKLDIPEKIVKEGRSFISGVVETPYDPVFVRIFTGKDYIHCVGIAGRSEAINSVVRGVQKIKKIQEGEIRHSPDAASVRVRELAKGRISLHLKHDIEDIDIFRLNGPRGLGFPIVFIKGNKALVDISLSHDGNFVSYAFLS